MKLIFIHGWSVTSTKTYGELPQVIQREAPNALHVEVENIYLGEYISFHDEVSLEDIAQAFEKARVEKLGSESFVCITHSTGAPVIRLWLDLFFKDALFSSPLSHLIMLAPANHGSSLALLGKSKLSRIKAWVEGMEPGVGVLDWLELGSIDQWELNNSWLDYAYDESTFFPFVFSGEKIDEHFYDFINPYLVEKGSDGVVRLCGANLNYTSLRLIQNCSLKQLDSLAYPLVLEEKIKTAPTSAFEVIPHASHTGEKHGIMSSVKKKRVVKPVVNSIIEALHVKTNEQYKKTQLQMKKRSDKTQEKTQSYVMFIFNVMDNYGNTIHDYDMLLLAGKNYNPSKLPKDFFVDRQKNDTSGNLVYYLNYNKLCKIKDGKLGIRIVARPDEGFAHYNPAEFHSKTIELEKLFKPNQSVMVNVILERRIAENTFVLDKIEDAQKDFKDREPLHVKVKKSNKHIQI